MSKQNSFSDNHNEQSVGLDSVEPSASTDERRKELSRKTAVNIFLQNYAVKDNSSPSASRKSGKNRDGAESGDYGKPGKGLRIAAGISALVILAIAAYFFFPIESLQDKKEETNALIQSYQDAAQIAFERSDTFNAMCWSSSNEALSCAADLLNGYLSGEQLIQFDNNRSYATAGSDAWGNPIYITALQQENGRNKTFKYDFYIISGGENGRFDTNSLRLDADDIYAVLYSMPKAKAVSSVAGFAGFEIETEEAVGPSIPIAFDQQGGDGGTTIIQAAIGDILPEIEPPQKEGYTFLGYYDAPVGGTMYYNEAGEGYYICRQEHGITLYAHWTETAETLPVLETERITITVQHFVPGDNGYPEEPTKTSTVIRAAGKVNFQNLADESIIDSGKSVYLTQYDGSDMTSADLKEDASVQIYYIENTHTVFVSKGKGIAFVSGANQYAPGETVILSATTIEGYAFSCWRGDYVGTEILISFTMPNRDVRIEAVATVESVPPETDDEAEDVLVTVNEEPEADQPDEKTLHE